MPDASAATGDRATKPRRRVGFATVDDAAAAVEILREAARWTAVRFGEPIWDPASFDVAAYEDHARQGELVGGYDEDGRMVACMLLQRRDPLFWPEDPPGVALYLHKVAIRRSAAGDGWLGRLIEWSVERARSAGVVALRLDTLADGRLPALYASLGFHPVDDAPLVVDGRRLVRLERRVRE